MEKTNLKQSIGRAGRSEYIKLIKDMTKNVISNIREENDIIYVDTDSVIYLKNNLNKEFNLTCSKYKEIKKDDCEIKFLNFKGGYLESYLKYVYLSKDTKIPALFIDDILFMSITPMEIRSHINPIKWSNGNVLVGGLGMGYFVNELIKKDNVDHIDIVEINKNVIDMYIETFGLNDKITIWNEDIFKFVGRVVYDYFYADIWSDRNYNNQIRDSKLFKNKIKCKTYSFWGVEEALYDLMNSGYNISDSINILNVCPNLLKDIITFLN